MIRNKNVVSFKPSLESATSAIPKNELVFTSKPKIESMVSPTTNRLYEITLGRGMLVGFGPAITYPENIMVITAKQT